MNDSSEGTKALELVDVIADLTRRHNELLGCLRGLKDAMLKVSATVGPEQSPQPRVPQLPPLGAEVRAAPIPDLPPSSRALDGPALALSPDGAPGSDASRARSDSRETNSAPPGDLRASAAESRHPGGSSVPFRPLTKRHYDYFAELDDLLARLPVTPSLEIPELPLNDEHGLPSAPSSSLA